MGRLKTIGALLIPLAVLWGHASSALGEDPLRKELQELDRMRKGKQTPTDKVESRGGDLLEEHPSPEEQGRIHYQLAHVHAQSAQKDLELVIEHAQRALSFPLDPDLRLRAYVYWGDALRILHRRKKAPYAEGRRLAAPVYLEGLKETQKYRKSVV